MPSNHRTLPEIAKGTPRIHMTKTVAIIGAGIVGVSTALWLQRDGHKVILIDKKGPAEGTSYGNAGILASCAVVPVTGPGLIKKAPKMALDRNQPLFMKWSYLPRLMPWLVKYLRHANATDTKRIARALKEIVGDSLADHLALAQGTRAEKWIVPTDYMYAYNDRAHFNSDAFAWSVRAENGFTWDEIEAEEFRQIEPDLSPDLGFGIRMGNHGRIEDPGQYVKDLAAEVTANGGQLITSSVQDIIRENGAVTGLRTETETIPCDTAVIATGVWSGPLCKKLGLNMPQEAERGMIEGFQNSM